MGGILPKSYEVQQRGSRGFVKKDIDGKPQLACDATKVLAIQNVLNMDLTKERQAGSV